MKVVLLAFGSMVALGCSSDAAQVTPTTGKTEALASPESPGPTRASSEAREPDPPSQEVQPAVEPATNPEPSQELPFRVTANSSGRGEDGLGNRVESEDAVYVDAVSEMGWPGRAMDPALHVLPPGGQPLVFRHYEIVDIVALRFGVARPSLLEGAQLWIQYGDEEHSRVALVPETTQ